MGRGSARGSARGAARGAARGGARGGARGARAVRGGTRGRGGRGRGRGGRGPGMMRRGPKPTKKEIKPSIKMKAFHWDRILIGTEEERKTNKLKHGRIWLNVKETKIDVALIEKLLAMPIKKKNEKNRR